jgi:hypothetical protein
MRYLIGDTGGRRSITGDIAASYVARLPMPCKAEDQEASPKESLNEPHVEATGGSQNEGGIGL